MSILVQVGVFAFACYIAVIPAVLVLSAFDALGESIKRETKEAVQLVVGIVLILLFALLIRLFVFYDGIGTRISTPSGERCRRCGGGGGAPLAPPCALVLLRQ